VLFQLPVLAGARGLPLFQSVQTGPVRGVFSGGKMTGQKFNLSLTCSAEVKNEYSYTSTPPYAFMASIEIILPPIF
jgi:hypothetical protein